ncbi:glutathione S-transferase family protein [Bdellovibrionota bacterium FG-1]
MFENSTLFVSARSPFARRVRLAFRENGIHYEEKIIDVFKPNSELIALNPLARVPTIQLQSGDVLLESEKILQFLYDSLPNSPLQPQGVVEAVQGAHWSAIAVGLCEKTVEYYMETLRPQDARDSELFAEIRDIATRVLERFDGFIEGRETVLPGRVTQVDLDLGAALTYFSLRYSPQWQTRYSHVARYLRHLEERPSFQVTRPPTV